MRDMIRLKRAYSLLEVLLTVSLLGLLLFVVGDSISHVLATTTLGETRHEITQSGDELASRLAAEARSSTAVFVPSLDVLGQQNAGPGPAHEVDFFRKASDGTPTFVAYRYDAQLATVARYEYVPVAGGAAQIIHQDGMAVHVASFAAARSALSAVGGIVGSDSVKPVNIYYGTPELVGGNSIVTVSITSGLSGEPQRHFDVHLSSRAAPTDLSILVPSGTPPPSPSPSSSPIPVAFLLVSPNFHPPHGPNHGSDPGGQGHGPGSIPGKATFYGLGSGEGNTWFELTSQFGVIENGLYSVHDSSGSTVTVLVDCDGSPCPPFVPTPIATASSAIVFDTTK